MTRDGQPVAELRQLGRPPLRAQQLLERWRHLPVLDGPQLLRDVDDAVATDLWPRRQALLQRVEADLEPLPFDAAAARASGLVRTALPR